MPLYDYQCQHCKSVFEVRATFREKELGLDPECPQCHRKGTRKLLSSGILLLRRSDSGSTCGPKAGPGCCG